MRILSWDCHEGLLTAWAMLGHQIDLLPYVPEWAWNIKKRPIPWNVKLITDYHIEKYDLVVAFNEHKQLPMAKRISDELKIPRIVSLASLQPIRDMDALCAERVYLCSHTQGDQLGIDGQVVYYPINADEFKGYIGQNGCVLSTINYFGQKCNRKSRGFDFAHQVTDGLVYHNWGHNLDGDEYKCPHPDNFDQLKQLYRDYAVYLDPVVASPMSMSCLEAMSTGMPMVTRPHDDWPLILQDGKNAIMSNNIDYLRKKLRELIHDEPMRQYIGGNARKMIIDKFSVHAWINTWENEFKKLHIGAYHD